MTPKTKIYVNLVGVVVLAVVMVGWVFLNLMGTTLGAAPLRITVDLAGSGGVFTNQEVTYRGVLVGQVGEMSLNDDGIDIELIIEPEWEGRIPDSVHATVRSKSAVGEQFVNLTPDGPGNGTLRDGDEIPRERTSLPVDFQELLRTLDAVLADVPVDRTVRLTENLADGLRGRADDIATVLSSLGRLSETFASVAEEQKSLLDNSTAAGEAFLRTKDSFSAAIRAADEVFAGLGEDPEDLRRFFAENDRLAREGIALLARSGSDLRAGIRGLADLATFQLENQDVMLGSLEHTPGFLAAIEEASVPWRSPDGREFYRIRVGLVRADDRKEFWPCKYGDLPFEYERLPHVRDRKKIVTDVKCEEVEGGSEATRSLVNAMQEYAAEFAGSGNAVPLSFGDTTASPGDVSFGWPITGVVTSHFGPRWGAHHAGIDIDGVTGDPIGASAGGTVVTAGYNDGGYGNVVVIDHGGGFSTLYSHLDEIGVVVGEGVAAGQTIGTVGCTGRCFGDHLHFEIRVGGVGVDPLPLLPGGALFLTPQPNVTADPAPVAIGG